ncbi:LysR family transcriptional regulator [Micromonosporaceae bacterium Da 78-11]
MIDNQWLSPQAGRVDLDTALLRAFLATADERHFGRAAERLHLTQQALSKRIARLETLLGVRLLDRTTRRVEPTVTGLRLLGPFRDAVDAIDAVAVLTGQGAGPVRIDVMEEHTAATMLVRRAVERDPLLRVEVTSRGGALTLLRDGVVDIAFGRAYQRPWPARVRRRGVLAEPVGLLVGAGHPWFSREQVPAADLRGAALRFPMFSAPQDWVTFADELARDFGFALDSGGSNIGFDHFLGSTAEQPQVASFYGMEMPLPGDDRLRVVPIVAPEPVFAWAAMWQRPAYDAVVDCLAAEMTLPDDVWLPAADRSWLIGGGNG